MVGRAGRVPHLQHRARLSLNIAPKAHPLRPLGSGAEAGAPHHTDAWSSVTPGNPSTFTSGESGEARSVPLNAPMGCT